MVFFRGGGSCKGGSRTAPTLNHPNGLAGDLQLLIGLDDQNGQIIICPYPLRLNFRDVPPSIPVLYWMNTHSQVLQSVENLFTDAGRILPDAPGEDQGIHPAEHGHVGANIFFDPVAEQIDGQSGPFISLIPRR